MVITVTCPSCSTAFPVDPVKVPEGGGGNGIFGNPAGLIPAAGDPTASLKSPAGRLLVAQAGGPAGVAAG